MKLTVLALLATLLASGCRRSVRDVPYDQLSDDDLVACVGTATYTKAELERDTEIIERFSTLAGFAPHEMACRQNPTKFRQQIVDGFVSRELLLQEADRRKITLMPDEMRAYQDEFARGLSERMPLNFNALLVALGPKATAFRNNLKKDALAARLQRIIRDELTATATATAAAAASAAERERSEALAFNRSADNANRQLARLATNAWKSIRAGSDFAVVGRKLSEMRAEVTYSPTTPDPLDRFAHAPVGLTLPPTATEGGIEVVRVSQAPNAPRKVSRIFFRLRPPRPLPPKAKSPEAARNQAIDAAYSNWLTARRRAANAKVAVIREQP